MIFFRYTPNKTTILCFIPPAIVEEVPQKRLQLCVIFVWNGNWHWSIWVSLFPPGSWKWGTDFTVEEEEYIHTQGFHLLIDWKLNVSHFKDMDVINIFHLSKYHIYPIFGKHIRVEMDQSVWKKIMDQNSWGIWYLDTNYIRNIKYKNEQCVIIWPTSYMKIYWRETLVHWY